MTDGERASDELPPIETDLVLLAEAEAALQEAGFATTRRTSGSSELPWVLAEDPFFVVAVASGRTLSDLRGLEAIVAGDLSELLATTELGAKRWDAHLVLLAADEAPSGSAAAALALQYDLRALRRIVAHGVAAKPERLTIALAPFLPLPEASGAAASTPLLELEQALVVNGVPADEAASAVAAFQQDGDLDAL